MFDYSLSLRLNNLEESATLVLNTKVKKLANEGKTVYNLTAGELDCPTPEKIVKAVEPKLYNNKYSPTAGLQDLREEITAHCNNFYKIDWITPGNIVVTAGAKPAIFNLLQTLLNPGDEVIIPVPAWVSYKYMVELAGGKAVTVSLLKNYQLDADAIERAITPKTRAIIINSPHNPTGVVFSDNSINKLAKILKDKKIFVIADDIYTKLVYQPYSPITKHGFIPDQLLIINGFSKSQALTGWRIGYAIANEKISSAMTKILSHTNGNAALPSQYAALAALSYGDRPVMLSELKKRREYVARILDRVPEITYILPGGAFYFFIDIRKIANDSIAWCTELLDKTGVALVPGDSFLSPGFVRLSFAVSIGTLHIALEKIMQYIKQERA